MITAKMQGRRLRLTVETEPDETPIEPFLVDPLTGREGREVSTVYLYVLEGITQDNGELGDAMTQSFGVENMKRAEDLSQHEGALLAQAAFFWQSVGGIDAVRELLKPDADGVQGAEEAQGKALAVFKLKIVPLLSQIRHLLELARQTQMESSPDTDTPQAGENSESKPDLPPQPPTAASQLPPNTAFARSPEPSD